VPRRTAPHNTHSSALRAVPERPRRVVLYRRVSALMGRSGDDFLSPDLQLHAMQRLVTIAGLQQVDVVDDIDVSGRTFSRDGLDKIRTMVEAHTIDAIAVYDVSRLGRNVLESLRFLAWIAEHGVTIISACEQVDTSTPAGKLMLTNMLAIAEYRSDEIGRGWSAAIDNRARRGRHHGRTYGYTRVDKTLVPDPTLAPIVADAFIAYAHDTPISQIAAEVAERRGKRIDTGAVKKWFRNPVYLGHVVAAGEIVAFGAHEPLVDEATWDTVQQRLARDAGTPARHLAPSWALVGLGFCPDGHRLQRMPTKYRGPVDRIICGIGPSRGIRGADCCSGIGYPRLEPVEAEVLRQVRVFMERLRGDHGARAEQIARRAQASVDRDEIERKLAANRAAMAKLAKAWALGDVSDAGFHAPMAEFRAAEVLWQQKLAGLRPVEVLASPDEAANAAEALLVLWPDATMAERNRLLRTVVRGFVVRRAAFWREPEVDRVSVEFL
jgi:site-specific DNA recombinase